MNFCARTRVVVALLLLIAVLTGWEVINALAVRSDMGIISPLVVRRRGSAICPQRIPSSGLTWSKRRYPEQYFETNRASATVTGLDSRDKERFLDIANRAYSRQFVTGFSYTDTNCSLPQVRIEYLRAAEAFVGTLTAKGLKPNFAYQMKLQGDHSTDPVSFERIGRLGRWRQRNRKGTNVSDEFYEQTEDKSVFESYVFFDFFVTDDQGNAEKAFYLDSSLHVLFNHPHQGTPRMRDSRLVPAHTEQTESWLYSNPKASVPPQHIFAQTEANQYGQIRPEIGEAFLPVGRYRGAFVLVEETFHGYRYGDSGDWPTVMECPVDFEVLDRERPTGPGWSGIEGGVTIPLDRLRLVDVEHRALASRRLTARVTGPQPSLTSTNAVHLGKGNRHVLSFDMYSRQDHYLRLYVDPTLRFRTSELYYVIRPGSRGWRTVQIEITPQHQADGFYLRFRSHPKEKRIGFRNMRLVEIPALP